MAVILFVGERRSATAIANGWTWRDGRLAAKQLFDALRACDIDPAACAFTNVFERGGKATIRRAVRDGARIVGLGRKVQRELRARKIRHTPLTHPAALGAIRRKDRYIQHVRDTLVEGDQG